MDLPTPIRTYFTARPPRDARAFVAAFAPDAVVHDEGSSHRGRQAIGDWWQAAEAKYRHEATPLDLSRIMDKVVVRARVSGEFPGSPAILTFTFGLAADRITDLEIG